MRKFISAIICLFAFHSFAAAQTKNAMESNGKIYVVLFVCLVILAGLIGYLFLLDRRISKMEKQNH